MNFFRNLSLWMSDSKKKFERVENTHRKIHMKIYSVYDGDTFTAMIVDADGCVRLRRCRCVGYDSPEMKKGTKEEANAAKNRLTELLPKKMFLCKTQGFDKYGRLLVNVKYKNKFIKDIMIEEGFGYEYNGGCKRAEGKKTTN